jgi:hypothetical protein
MTMKYRAYDNVGDVVEAGDTEGTVTFTTDKQIRLLAFYSGGGDLEVCVGSVPLNATGPVTVMFADCL